ncbi:MAG: hypothetical protein ACI9X4_000403, partial [Glaciecola sp.]
MDGNDKAGEAVSVTWSSGQGSFQWNGLTPNSKSDKKGADS